MMMMVNLLVVLNHDYIMALSYYNCLCLNGHATAKRKRWYDKGEQRHDECRIEFYPKI